tara:strand:- start:1075 stop:1233 length:159 start_codon:yes stop_codon:yes gene_type:complete
LRNAPRIPRQRSNIDVLFVNKYALGEIRVGKVSGKKKSTANAVLSSEFDGGP